MHVRVNNGKHLGHKKSLHKHRRQDQRNLSLEKDCDLPLHNTIRKVLSTAGKSDIRSHSLVSFRHSSDERNPPDVIGTPASVEVPGGRQRLDQNLDVQRVEGVLYESRYQNSHLSSQRHSSSEEALQHAFGCRTLCG